MLEILPIQLKAEQEALAARCKVKFEPDCMAYSATIDGGTIGICQFSMRSGVGHIETLALTPGTEDFEAIFLLGRAALNFIELCGVYEAYYDGEINDESLVLSIGFSKNTDGKYYINLTNFFTSPCQREKK